jgi:4'-phosphopantetheinyl transferase
MANLFGVFGAHALGESEFDALRSQASPARRERAGRYLRREDASRALVGEALLRFAARAAGAEIEGVPLHRNRYGKPFVSDADFEFNLSHSGERHHPIDFGIADRFFSPPENAYLERMAPGNAKLRAFFDIWAAKESYIKAIGKGLSCPLEGFACLPAGSARIEFLPIDGTLPRRNLQLLDFGSGYSCALCTVFPEPPVPLRLLSPEELIEALAA